MSNADRTEADRIDGEGTRKWDTDRTESGEGKKEDAEKSKEVLD